MKVASFQLPGRLHVTDRRATIGRATMMHHALTRHLQLGSVRNQDWVFAHYGHR